MCQIPFRFFFLLNEKYISCVVLRSAPSHSADEAEGQVASVGLGKGSPGSIFSRSACRPAWGAGGDIFLEVLKVLTHFLLNL